MKLVKLKLENFRCYKHLTLDSMTGLTVFVGENDAGKTVLLDAISLLVGAKSCDGIDCLQNADGSTAKEVKIYGEFLLEDFDTLPDEYRCRSGATLCLQRSWSKEGPRTAVTGVGHSDDRFDNFKDQPAALQKELLAEYNFKPASNSSGRIDQVAELISNGEVQLLEKSRNVESFARISPHLPRIVRTSSSDYRSPDSLIASTLRNVAASVVRPMDQETGQATELSELQKVRTLITDRLTEEILRAKEILSRSHHQLVDLKCEPSIDFTRSVVSVSLLVDLGGKTGLRPLESFGEGTRKRMWMGLQEWERQAAVSAANQSVIRLYDEPDVNLHYEAQRQMFSSIREYSEKENYRTQCFVCTHSVTLIDRAPIQSVNLINVADDGLRTVTRITGGEDEDFIKFFDEVARSVGLTNSALLYEKAFLIVEGESEENALPLIYKTLYGQSMIEGGIRVINLKSCGAWRPLLDVLLKNRSGIVHMLLDADCEWPGSSAKLTKERFAEIGIDEAFISEQITFIGTKEFEDAFSDELYVRALNIYYDHAEGAWHPEMINQHRSSEKFSEALANMVRVKCNPAKRNEAKKPGIAKAVAGECVASEVPESVRVCFEKLRSLAQIA